MCDALGGIGMHNLFQRLGIVFCTICPPSVAAKELTLLFVVVNKFCVLVPTHPGFTTNPAAPPVRSAIWSTISFPVLGWSMTGTT